MFIVSQISETPFHETTIFILNFNFQLWQELNALLATTKKAKDSEACDEAICTSIRKINEHRKRHAFSLGLVSHLSSLLMLYEPYLNIVLANLLQYADIVMFFFDHNPELKWNCQRASRTQS